MIGKIKHGKLIVALFVLMAINTIYSNVNTLSEKIENIATFIEDIEIDPFLVFKGGGNADPDNFTNF